MNLKLSNFSRKKSSTKILITERFRNLIFAFTDIPDLSLMNGKFQFVNTTPVKIKV